MAVLICKNIGTEGPGTIENYLKIKKIPYSIVELSKGEKVQGSDRFDTLIMLGGPMSVNDDITYIREEEQLVRDFVSKGKKVFGVCLGAQIMARALGARVYAGPQKEIGWYDINVTNEGWNDAVFSSLLTLNSIHLPVFHWHGETFDIPEGAVRLAGSALYPNQAFRYGEAAYAFQFHIEVTKDIICDWFKDDPVNLDKLKEETEKLYDVYHDKAMRFYEMFLAP